MYWVGIRRVPRSTSSAADCAGLPRLVLVAFGTDIDGFGPNWSLNEQHDSWSSSSFWSCLSSRQAVRGPRDHGPLTTLIIRSILSLTNGIRVGNTRRAN